MLKLGQARLMCACLQLETDRPVQWTFGIDGAVQDILVYEANAGPKDTDVWNVPSFCNTTGAANNSTASVKRASIFAMSR